MDQHLLFYEHKSTTYIRILTLPPFFMGKKLILYCICNIQLNGENWWNSKQIRIFFT